MRSDLPTRGPRKDAIRNRAQLISAASEAMRTKGAEVPMEAIAERAGVTRGTLYRNFANRQDLYEAVLERDLAQLAMQIERDSDVDPLAFIRHMSELMVLYDKFLVALSNMDDYDLQTNQRRLCAVIASPLQAAKEKGLLRGDLTADDVLIACRMLASPIYLDSDEAPKKRLSKRLVLIIRGIGATAPVTPRKRK